MVDRRRTLKWSLTIAGLIGMAALMIIFVQLRHHQGGPLPIPDTAARALMMLAGLHQTATKDGKLQWELDTESAQLEAGSGRMILKSPKVVFYMDDGDKVHLTAEQGVLDTGSSNMEVSGNVQVRSDRYTLVTEALAYLHEDHIMQTDVPVMITGSVFDLRADKMVYNLNSNSALFDGHVEGNLNEDVVP